MKYEFLLPFGILLLAIVGLLSKVVGFGLSLTAHIEFRK